MGATLYTAVSVFLARELADTGFLGDPSRISAQIDSGIGFLGGGAIIQAKGQVHGLTTAATIWVVAALGILVGVGYGWLAVVLAVLEVILLIGVHFIEVLVWGKRGVKQHEEVGE